jgi:hypothetical protein
VLQAFKLWPPLERGDVYKLAAAAEQSHNSLGIMRMGILIWLKLAQKGGRFELKRRVWGCGLGWDILTTGGKQVVS